MEENNQQATAKHCSISQRRAITNSRPFWACKEGTFLGVLFLHVALEMANEAGALSLPESNDLCKSKDEETQESLGEWHQRKHQSGP